MAPALRSFQRQPVLFMTVRRKPVNYARRARLAWREGQVFASPACPAALTPLAYVEHQRLQQKCSWV